MAADDRNPMRLAEGYFSAEDSRFVEWLRDVADPKQLAAFADRWKRDARPWAREQIIAYLQHPPNCIGHQPVVKRLFKQAEENCDDELMAGFAVLFDRLVRHERKTRRHFDWDPWVQWEEEYLVAAGEGMQFRYPTRYYLQRRAWRYFRRLGYRDASRYVSAIACVFARYEDEFLAKGENILDSWTLLQAGFRESDTLDFGRERIRVAEGRSLAELRAAPRFPEHWQTTEAFNLLIDLLDMAQSRLVRVWAIQLMEDEHAARIAQLPAEKLLALLRSSDPDVEQFAARLLEENDQLSQVPVATWLELLDTDSPAALDAISGAMRKHVTPDQLSCDDCLQLALREPAPVAQFGFDWLQQKPIEDRAQIADLADTLCHALASEMADWALGIVGSREFYDRDFVLRFFDSVTPAVRDRAWAWLEADECPGRDDPVLFCRLMETPFDDLRLRLVDLLEKRSLPGDAKLGLTAVWTSVLLGVERGGRQKLKATRQIAEAIVHDPSLADSLLPVLAVAVRSVRKPEARAGIAAVVTALARAPRTAEAVARHLPELEIVEAGMTA